MDEKLREVLEARRLAAGKKGRPLGYQSWGSEVGVMYTSLFRFAKGTGTLGVEALRTLAKRARDNDDNELIYALAAYALDMELPEVVAGETG